MSKRILLASIALLSLALAATLIEPIQKAWAANFPPSRLIAILNTAGSGTVLLQQDSAIGIPVQLVGSAAPSVWTNTQNIDPLAECGAGACPGAGCTALASETSKSVLIKADAANADLVWCDQDGSVGVDDGFDLSSEQGNRVGIADPSGIVCCGVGAATFKIAVQVEN